MSIEAEFGQESGRQAKAGHRKINATFTPIEKFGVSNEVKMFWERGKKNLRKHGATGGGGGAEFRFKP